MCHASARSNIFPIMLKPLRTSEGNFLFIGIGFMPLFCDMFDPSQNGVQKM